MRRKKCEAMPHLAMAVTAPTIHVVRLLQWMLTSVILCTFALSLWWWDQSARINETALQVEHAAERVNEANQHAKQTLIHAGLTLSAQQLTTIKRNVAFVNQLADKRAFSWARLLGDLEKAVPPRVAVQAVRLNFQDSTVSLSGVARTLHDINLFIEGLQRHPSFRNAALSDHHDVHQPGSVRIGGGPAGNETETGTGIVFQMTVLYRPSY
jgi:Tfp pilus assembly protein PilN